MTESPKPESIRQEVAETYGRRITESTSCCGGGTSTCCLPEGYDAPEKVQPTSYGCGNPLAFSEVREGQTVIDLGSGAGLDLLIAAEKVGASGHVIGVDMTDEMIDEARRNIALSGLRHVEVRRGIIEQLPVEDGSADWVISNCVINLSPEKPRVFAEIHRALKPGGQVSVTDIVVDELPEALRSSRILRDGCVAGAISEIEYRAGLEAAGLERVEAEELVVYDESLLRGLAAELEVSPEQVEDWIPAVRGKVRSLRFNARKPV